MQETVPELSVLHVARVADGGMRKHLHLLLTGLRNRGLDIALAGSGLNLDVPGVIHHPIDIVDGIRIGQDAMAVMRLRRLLMSSGWSIVHAHGWKAGMVTALARFLHGQPPMVMTLHNELSPRFTGWRRWLLGSALDLPLRCSDAIACVSTSLSRSIQKRRGIPAEKLVTVLNGVDLSEIDRTQSDHTGLVHLFQSRQGLLIGTVARLIPEKGISDLLQAFFMLRRDGVEAHLVVIGDGPNRLDFVSQARLLGISSEVSFLGWRDDALPLMREFDLFVLPSWSEGTPMTVMEAMAVGTPVIVTDVGGIRDLVEHMRTGVVVEARSPNALADAIKELIEDEELRAQLSRAAFDHARSEFGHTVMVEKTIQLYEAVLRQALHGHDALVCH